MIRSNGVAASESPNFKFAAIDTSTKSPAARNPAASMIVWPMSFLSVRCITKKRARMERAYQIAYGITYHAQTHQQSLPACGRVDKTGIVT